MMVYGILIIAILSSTIITLCSSSSCVNIFPGTTKQNEKNFVIIFFFSITLDFSANPKFNMAATANNDLIG